MPHTVIHKATAAIKRLETATIFKINIPNLKDHDIVSTSYRIRIDGDVSKTINYRKKSKAEVHLGKTGKEVRALFRAIRSFDLGGDGKKR